MLVDWLYQMVGKEAAKNRGKYLIRIKEFYSIEEESLR